MGKRRVPRRAVCGLASTPQLGARASLPDASCSAWLAVRHHMPTLLFCTPLQGVVNLERHIRNTRSFGVPVVVAVNRFATDTDAEIEAVIAAARAAGASDAVLCTHHAEGGKGAVALGNAVIKACQEGTAFRFTYELDLSIKDKIAAIAKGLYGAADVSYSEQAEKQIALFEAQGYGSLPICMAKTQYSFSHDASAKVRGRGTAGGAARVASGGAGGMQCLQHAGGLVSLGDRSSKRAMPLRWSAGRPVRVRPSHPRRAALCRGRVRLPARGNHHDDAGAAHASVLLRHRHRLRDGQGRGSVLSRLCSRHAGC